jgi:dihydrofolate reductase
MACIDSNCGIGFENKLLFNIENDLQFFKSYTKGKTVVMGRKTFESLPFFLNERINIIVTSDVNFGDVVKAKPRFDVNKSVATFDTFDNVLQYIIGVDQETPATEFVIIGGGHLYESMIPFADRLLLTRVDYSCDKVDTYFPKWNKKSWDVNRQLTSDTMAYTDDIHYNFVCLDRKLTAKVYSLSHRRELDKLEVVQLIESNYENAPASRSTS